LKDPNASNAPSEASPETEDARSRIPGPSRLLDATFSEGDNIEKIREILFGAQMRRYEERFLGLKERITAEVADLRQDIGRRLTAVEDHVEQELSSLGARLQAEQEEQSETLRSISREVQEKSGFYKKKIKQLADQIAKSHRDGRRQLMAETQRISEDVRKKQEETLTMLDEAVRKLNAEAVDRPTLSRLFQEMAIRLDADLADRINAEIDDRADA